MSRVTVVGDATLDVRVVPAEPPRSGGDTPASIGLGPGGQGANIAARLARRGVRPRLVCRLGDDPAGDLVRAALTADGVELVDLGAASTGTVVVLLDASGDRTMLSQRMPLIEGGGMAPEILAEPEWLVVSGYILLERSAGISASGDRPRRVVAGCSLAPPEVGDWSRAVRLLLPHLVVLNIAEATVLAGVARTPSELSQTLADALGALVVVTEPNGAIAFLAGDVVRTDNEADVTPLDTTGAGDAFTAGLVAGLLEAPWPPTADVLRGAMRAAAALAAAVTRVPGAQARVPGEVDPA